MIDVIKSNSIFSYNISLDLSNFPKNIYYEKFKDISELSLLSRNFNNYNDCATSVKAFINHIVNDINSSTHEKYSTTSEVNPLYSGVDSTSDSWEEYELARIWIFNDEHGELEDIQSIVQARIFTSTLDSKQLVN